jgi:hypothetical protein
MLASVRYRAQKGTAPLGFVYLEKSRHERSKQSTKAINPKNNPRVDVRPQRATVPTQ